MAKGVFGAAMGHGGMGAREAACVSKASTTITITTALSGRSAYGRPLLALLYAQLCKCDIIIFMFMSDKSSATYTHTHALKYVYFAVQCEHLEERIRDHCKNQICKGDEEAQTREIICALT